MSDRRARWTAVWALAGATLAGCSSPAAVRSLPSGTAAPAPATATTGGGPPTPTSDAAFSAAVDPVTADDLAPSWHEGCPLGPDGLRLVRLTHWGFDGRSHAGALVVGAAYAEVVVTMFRRLYDQRFPIRRMDPVAVFGGDDNASMAADNTSGFNCRYAVAPGPPRWSAHAYGTAIDVNPVENPYVLGTEVLPPAGVEYLDRSAYRPGMAVAGGQLTAAFAGAGWSWGGEWASPDYQHFDTG